MKMYFKGGEGITNPVDVEGNEIVEGDILTHPWFEDDYVQFFNKHLNETDLEVIEARVHAPSVIVIKNSYGGFFFGDSLDGDSLYMHDFRFKYTKKLCNISDLPV